MTKSTISKLNTTGTLYHDSITDDIVSYTTPIYKKFKLSTSRIIKVFNDTYYSSTTRKHQFNIRYLKGQSDLILYYCPYGNWSLAIGLKNEITMTEYKLEKLQNKTRKLGVRQAQKLEELTKRLKELQDLYKEVI